MEIFKISCVSITSYSMCWLSMIYSYFKIFNNLPEKNGKTVVKFIPGFLHSLIICPIITYFFLLTDEIELLKYNIYGRSLIVECCISISLGFFVYDLSIGLLTNNYIDILHGLISGTLCLCIYYPFIQYQTCIFLLFEVSSIPYNIRMIMIHTNSAHGIKFTIVELLFVVLFLGIRIYWGIPICINSTFDIIRLIYLGKHHSTIQCLLILISSNILSGLNIYWSYGIFKKIIYKCKNLNKTINN